MMRPLLGAFAVSLFVVACGVDQATPVESPDAWIAKQDQEGAKQLAEQKKHKGEAGEPKETEDEKIREWDQKQADLELKRATRSAETCPESVTEKSPKGMASVTLVFANDGRVKDSKIDDVYADKAVGTCVLRAMSNVIVPAYKGAEHTVEWQIDLTGAKQKKSGPKGGDSNGG
ncbi:MAG TPA: hypothetical protein VGQ57_11710 [Polyangiaceae bacterium]|jgi:hypothetical protein|nr:hypothetical protein [Polyangiaceae bacterium]